jgi:hypothetical protein
MQYAYAFVFILAVAAGVFAFFRERAASYAASETSDESDGSERGDSDDEATARLHERRVPTPRLRSAQEVRRIVQQLEAAAIPPTGTADALEEQEGVGDEGVQIMESDEKVTKAWTGLRHGVSDFANDQSGMKRKIKKHKYTFLQH